jgi:hypothetical protein
VPPDQRWRYALGTLLLFVAVSLAVAACFGVTAEAGSFKTEVLGAKIEGSSILVLSIIVFVIAALSLLSVDKRNKKIRHKAKIASADRGIMAVRPRVGQQSMAMRPNDDSDVVDYPDSLLPDFINIALIAAAAVLMIAGIITTRIIQ